MDVSLQTLIDHLKHTRLASVVALTGAGISAESGVPTFRGPGGLWESHRPEDLATPAAFHRDPRLVWRWYEWRRELVSKATPNAGHAALVRLEEEAAGLTVTVVTQNVDGLHALAGSTRLLEVHGNIFRVRCTREGEAHEHRDSFAEIPPACSCGAMLRPDVVWFGEAVRHLDTAAAAVSGADLLLVVGTSGTVYPAAGLLDLLRHGKSVEINPEPTPLSRSCDYSIRATAANALPLIVETILGSRR